MPVITKWFSSRRQSEKRKKSTEQKKVVRLVSQTIQESGGIKLRISPEVSKKRKSVEISAPAGTSEISVPVQKSRETLAADTTDSLKLRRFAKIKKRSEASVPKSKALCVPAKVPVLLNEVSVNSQGPESELPLVTKPGAEIPGWTYISSHIGYFKGTFLEWRDHMMKQAKNETVPEF